MAYTLHDKCAINFVIGQFSLRVEFIVEDVVTFLTQNRSQ